MAASSSSLGTAYPATLLGRESWVQMDFFEDADGGDGKVIIRHSYSDEAEAAPA